MHCNNCNLDLLPTIKESAPHIGAYCSFCGKWIKWLSKKERLRYSDLKGEPYSTLTGKSERFVTLDEITEQSTDNSFDDTDNGEVPW